MSYKPMSAAKMPERRGGGWVGGWLAREGGELLGEVRENETNN